jgi:hypothetical protein
MTQRILQNNHTTLQINKTKKRKKYHQQQKHN